MNKKVYLTFDDGPHVITKDILDLLDEYNAKATFFMLEPSIKKYADSVKEMVKRGHIVGLHGVTHNKDIVYKSKESFLNEMNQTRETLKEITGVNSMLIRAPYGSVPYVTNEYRELINSNRYKMWDWNVDSRDWEYRDNRYVESVIQQVEKLSKSDKPIIVLLHEFPKTLEYLRNLLEYFKEQEYEYGKIDESMEPIQFRARS